MNQVIIHFEEKDKAPVTIQVPKGDSVLEACFENDIELHHNCGGVCACSTCHIYIENGESCITELSDKEENFIDRAKNPKINSRLACQCVLMTENNTLTLTIPDQTLLLGD